MDISWTLNLPRDAASVPLVRRLLVDAMETAGVDPDVGYDIGLALSEACANVVEHAGMGAAYRVSAGIDATSCRVDVSDHGAGFPPGLLEASPEADPLAEHGRGLKLLRNLMDRVTLTNEPDGGTVHFEKDLKWRRLTVRDARLVELWQAGDEASDPAIAGA